VSLNKKLCFVLKRNLPIKQGLSYVIFRDETQEQLLNSPCGAFLKAVGQKDDIVQYSRGAWTQRQFPSNGSVVKTENIGVHKNVAKKTCSKKGSLTHQPVWDPHRLKVLFQDKHKTIN
jgi:hypothetical protein